MIQLEDHERLKQYLELLEENTEENVECLLLYEPEYHD